MKSDERTVYRKCSREALEIAVSQVPTPELEDRLIFSSRASASGSQGAAAFSDAEPSRNPSTWHWQFPNN